MTFFYSHAHVDEGHAEDVKQILAKVYMEGRSHAEAAAELDLPLGTVKSRVRLAMQKLQVQFERNLEPGVAPS